MAQHLSPGVYTKIIDLSEYVQTVPSTIGFIPIICEKGPDNELTFTNARDFYYDFGTPNIQYAGKNYGQGPYIASSFLLESDSLFVLRCLPSDADFANISIQAEGLGNLGADNTSDISVLSWSGLNTINEIDTHLSDDNSAIIFYGVGRGEHYNDYQINISKHANPRKTGVYIFDLYERQGEDDVDTGLPDYEITLTLEVSFDPTKLDESGESMFIVDVINRYSRYIKCRANTDLCSFANANGADFSMPFVSGPIQLANGTSGSLFGPTGLLDQTVATQILTQAYLGMLPKNYRDNSGNPLTVEEVLDTDNFYFNIILDGGYPSDVKQTGIYTLATTRMDSLAVIDNGDNPTVNSAITARRNDQPFNTRYMALYESYSKIYDSFTGRDIWVSPVYHMANIIPYTDNVAEVWWAPAGFNRATIGTIKELRFNPRLGDRDQFYLEQINPIVKFNVGYTVWSQLTCQKRPSALQDVNIMRLVLYIKRALEQFCKFYVFEQNDEATWSAIATEVNRFLKEIKNKRGLDSYSVSVGSTDYEKKRKVCHVDVILEPTRVIEQIQLNFYIK